MLSLDVWIGLEGWAGGQALVKGLKVSKIKKKRFGREGKRGGVLALV
ncbi:MAG: hypothetical protein ACRBBP_04330 [Bdellovibrionales bacterium]